MLYGGIHRRSTTYYKKNVDKIIKTGITKLHSKLMIVINVCKKNGLLSGYGQLIKVHNQIVSLSRTLALNKYLLVYV